MNYVLYVTGNLEIGPLESLRHKQSTFKMTSHRKIRA